MAAQLAKAVVIDTRSNDSIPVMYNPEEYRLDHGNEIAEIPVPGLRAPPLQYVRGRARTLSMDLLFDTYERAADVRDHTRRLIRLLDPVGPGGGPPLLLFVMGRLSFECLLVQADQRFTMFARDGTPVRATLSARFQEHVRAAGFEVRRGLFVGPPTLHNLTQGETLSGLAADYLGDPARWREIADANALDDPLRLPPGQALVIPGGERR
jgi:hypothetical protein